jgi:NADH dehydrogenase (ubiquinone) 1 beta subcomplex subunit 8
VSCCALHVRNLYSDSLEQNGGYVNPPPVKRSLRDPYEDWWDKQERRNYGEPVHEDNDMLGVFSLEEYNQWGPAKAAKVFLGYFAAIGAFSGAMYWNFYPHQPAIPKTFPGGLEAELGGKKAFLVCARVDSGEYTDY